MSLQHRAKLASRLLLHRLIVNYGRYMSYSKWIDRINRRPLLQTFAQNNVLVPSFSSREAMWSFIASRRPMAIDYLEFGVHQGHSIFHFASENRSAGSRFFGFDSFTGLPEDWNSDYQRGHFDVGGKPPKTDDPRIEFVVGSFQETLPKFIANFKTENRIVVHLDCDLYSQPFTADQARFCSAGRNNPDVRRFGDVQHEFRAIHERVIAGRSASCARTVTFLRSESSFNDRTAWSLVGRKQRERGCGCAVTGGHSSLRRHSDELVEITVAAAQSVRDFRDEGVADSGCNNRDRRRRWPARQDQHRGVGDGAHLRFREPAGDQPPRGIVGVGRIGADHAREACLRRGDGLLTPVGSCHQIDVSRQCAKNTMDVSHCCKVLVDQRRPSSP